MSSFLDYSTAGLTSNNPLPVSSTRNPTSSDVIAPDGAPYNVGRTWVNTSTSAIYNYAGHGVWVALSTGASGPIDTLTGGTGGALTPTAGNMNLLGTANQITSTGSGSTITFSLPAAIITPGSLTTTTTLAATTGNIVASTGNISSTLGSISAATTVTAGTGITATTGNISATAGAVNAGTSMTATLGNITATNGNVVLSTAGNKIVIATGANASVGTSDAMAGTPGVVVVATTASSATAKIFYSRATTGGTPGEVSITAQDATGFTLTSTGNETSTFNWWIINA